MIFVLLVAFGLRLAYLAVLPPGIYYDEAYNALDALWMLENYSPQIFLLGNNGREPMFHYLAALAMGLFGISPFSFRLVSVYVGVFTVAVAYRWGRDIFVDDPRNWWFGLIVAAGMATSFWHVVISRTGFRAILSPLFVMLVTWLFWQGWRKRSWYYLVLAGIALGLSQYTYISARLIPLILVGFVFSWTILLVATYFRKTSKAEQFSSRPKTDLEEVYNQLKNSWLKLSVVLLVSALVFLPLGLFF